MDQIDAELAPLKALETTLLHMSKDMLEADEGRMFYLDVMAVGAVNRALAQIRGFDTLVRSRNYLCAAPMVRLQLDIPLRFQAAWLVPQPHEFAKKVWEGTHVRKMKDRDGNRMTDKFLVDRLAERFPWVDRVYGETSGFVHLSEKHFYTAIQNAKQESADSATANIFISGSLNIPEQLYVEIIKAFISATNIFVSYLESWVSTKNNPRKFEP